MFMMGGGGIYDANGKSVASCNYAWSDVEPICEKLENCQAIYRVRNNIWGLPAVP
jgi:hypothetical protein